MLALTRKKGEALVINNNIEITVLEIRGDQIKIGISAPKDVPIYRKEVYLQIQQENETKETEKKPFSWKLAAGILAGVVITGAAGYVGMSMRYQKKE